MVQIMIIDKLPMVIVKELATRGIFEDSIGSIFKEHMKRFPSGFLGGPEDFKVDRVTVVAFMLLGDTFVSKDLDKRVQL